MAKLERQTPTLTSAQRQRLVMEDIHRHVGNGQRPIDAARMALLAQVYEGPEVAEMMALTFGVEGAAARFYDEIKTQREQAISLPPQRVVPSTTISPSTEPATHSPQSSSHQAVPITRSLPRVTGRTILDVQYPMADGRWLPLRMHRKIDLEAARKRKDATAEGYRVAAEKIRRVIDLMPNEEITLGEVLGVQQVQMLLSGVDIL